MYDWYVSLSPLSIGYREINVHETAPRADCTYYPYFDQNIFITYYKRKSIWKLNGWHVFCLFCLFIVVILFVYSKVPLYSPLLPPPNDEGYVFQERWDFVQWITWYILKIFRLTPCIQEFIFPFFFWGGGGGGGGVISNITVRNNGCTELFLKFSGLSGYGRRNNMEHFRCCIHPLNLRSSLYFLDLYLLATLRETGKQIFMKFSTTRFASEKKIRKVRQGIYFYDQWHQIP